MAVLLLPCELKHLAFHVSVEVLLLLVHLVLLLRLFISKILMLLIMDGQSVSLVRQQQLSGTVLVQIMISMMQVVLVVLMVLLLLVSEVR